MRAKDPISVIHAYVHRCSHSALGRIFQQSLAHSPAFSKHPHIHPTHGHTHHLEKTRKHVCFLTEKEQLQTEFLFGVGKGGVGGRRGSATRVNP